MIHYKTDLIDYDGIITDSVLLSYWLSRSVSSSPTSFSSSHTPTALQIVNLWTRAFFSSSVGIDDLPLSVAFFSSVEIDTVLRKSVTDDAITPSNPAGLEKEFGIGKGESINIYKILEITGGTLISNNHESSDSD